MANKTKTKKSRKYGFLGHRVIVGDWAVVLIRNPNSYEIDLGLDNFSYS